MNIQELLFDDGAIWFFGIAAIATLLFILTIITSWNLICSVPPVWYASGMYQPSPSPEPIARSLALHVLAAGRNGLASTMTAVSLIGRVLFRWAASAILFLIPPMVAGSLSLRKMASLRTLKRRVTLLAIIVMLPRLSHSPEAFLPLMAVLFPRMASALKAFPPLPTELLWMASTYPR